jgi:predicted ribosomally synthesized peptide with SipW-like signal peptide
MAEHRAAPARRSPRSRFGSVRVRALLCLGLVLGVFVTGTYAFWTDDVTITGSTFTAGVLDLQVNNADSYTTTTLGMSSTPMVPGNTSAEVLTVKNNGNVPLKYTLTGGLAGTDAAAYNTAASIKLTVVAGGTRSGTGNAATCTGGTTIYGPTALTNTTSTAIIGTRRGPIAAAGTEALCFQVTFDTAAPSSLQGKTATATFTATGTSDVS